MNEKKQIEVEMLEKILNDYEKEVRAEFPVTTYDLSTMIIENGYRKQSEGEWKPTSIPSYFGGVIYECSLCGAKDGDHTAILGAYCWRCGAKMKGGAE